MNQSKKNETHVLENVKCEVDSCCFNTCDGKCTAKAIEVTPRGDCTDCGTDCATFIPRENYEG